MIPDWLALLFFVLVPAVAAVAVHAVVRRLVPPDKLIPHHDVAGFLVAIVGVLYAVVLGFLVVTVWSTFNDVQNDADAEAFAVADAYGMAGALPEPQRTHVRGALAAYAVEVQTVEWPTLASKGPDQRARALILQALRELGAMRAPASEGFAEALREQSVVNNVVTSLRQVWDNRRKRLIEATQHLQPALMLAICLGGLMVLAFVFLFGIANEVLQLTMTSIVAGCIGLLFGVIVEFNSPYGGLTQVSPSAWNYIVVQNHFTPRP
ncbi:MAG: DUF4239 domain-containing protein [Candidatus Eremiobacteraeota bacterium]|nr:DUF4239 domain-containing protein [Candidatus Eremiobacteraeota bacterium]